MTFAGIFLLVCCAAEADKPFVFDGKVSELKLAPEELGQGWKGPTGLVVDDIEKLDGLKPAEKSAAETLAPQLKELGARGMADFTYDKTGQIRSVTLRVFVFNTPEAAAKFTKERWFNPAFKDTYKAIEGVGDEAADVVNTPTRPKRNVRVGNLVITAGEVPKGETYLKALEAILAKLKRP